MSAFRLFDSHFRFCKRPVGVECRRDEAGWTEALRDADAVTLREVEVPEPGPGEVRVRVHGSSVNKGDRLVMSGTPYVMRLALGLGAPRRFGLGQDVAGVASAVGEGSWVEEGRVTPLFESRCTLDELPQALRDLESGDRRGKILVEVVGEGLTP